jgi:two-component system LytT family sensor kinase
MDAVPKRDGEGIGISNVRQRLELRYGDQARLSIHSARGKGTRVHISLPADPAAPDAAP